MKSKASHLGIILGLTVGGLLAFAVLLPQRWNTAPVLVQSVAAQTTPSSGVGPSGDYEPSGKYTGLPETLFQHVYPVDPNDHVTLGSKHRCSLLGTRGSDDTDNECIPLQDITYKLGLFVDPLGENGTAFVDKARDPASYKFQIVDSTGAIRDALGKVAGDSSMNLIARWFLDRDAFRLEETRLPIPSSSDIILGRYSTAGRILVQTTDPLRALFPVQETLTHELLHYFFDKIDARVRVIRAADGQLDKAMEDQGLYKTKFNAEHSPIRTFSDRFLLVSEVRQHNVKLAHLLSSLNFRAYGLRDTVTDYLKKKDLAGLHSLFTSQGDGFTNFYTRYVDDAADLAPESFVGYTAQENEAFVKDLKYLNAYTAALYWQAFRLAIAFIDAKCGAAVRCDEKDKTQDLTKKFEDIFNSQEFSRYFLGTKDKPGFVPTFANEMADHPLDDKGNFKSLASTAYDRMTDQINLLNQACKR